MTTNTRLTQALFEQKGGTEQRNPLIAGTLGIAMNGQTLVEVPNRASYVYVQVRSSTAEVIQAFNSTVSPVYGLPVMIQWQGNRYVVVERDTMRYSNWGDFSPYLPRHASTHEFIGSAGDVVFVSQQQILPLIPTPSGSIGNQYVLVGDYNLMSTGGTFSYSPLMASKNLTVWNPSSPTGAVMVLISLDASNGQLRYDVGSGSVFGYWLTGTADVLPNVPAVPDVGRYLPIMGVRLVSGTSIITWDNIYDLRQMFGVTRGVGGGGGGGAAGGMLSGSAPIWLNNGVFVATGTQINLLGSNFTLTNSGTEIDLTILGGGGGGGTGFLALDTSNGPLVGPLVVYQKSPNISNQYFDFSTIVGFLSGTNSTPFAKFAAAGEFVNWSTGIHNYGVYIDDEAGGAPSLGIQDQGLMDKVTFQIDENIGANWKSARYTSPLVQWTRNGNGVTPYGASVLLINQAASNRRDTKAAIELDVNFGQYTFLWPSSTGSPMSFPFAFFAPYQFDTLISIPSGSPLAIWNNSNLVQDWLMPDGAHFMDLLGLMEHTGTVNYTHGNALGRAKLSNGTVTIATKRTTAAARIFLTPQDASGATITGFPYVYTRGPGSGFTVRSTNLTDNYDVAWLIVEPHIGE